MRARPGSNQGPFGLRPNALPLSYVPIRFVAAAPRSGEVAEWSKALRSGRSLFGGVGSNPTLTTFLLSQPGDQKLEMQGIDPCTSRMLSERSTI